MAERKDRRIALVTDSTASLTAACVAELGITVVPVQVIIGATVYDDEVATPEMVATALKEWTPVSTSRPRSSRSTCPAS
jgi:fatty acid-binding protein DegV